MSIVRLSCLIYYIFSLHINKICFLAIKTKFAINIHKVSRNDFINCLLNSSIFFFLIKRIRISCNTSKICTRIVPFFRVPQEPLGEVLERIVYGMILAVIRY